MKETINSYMEKTGCYPSVVVSEKYGNLEYFDMNVKE